MSQTLTSIQPGTCGTILEISLNEESRSRLMELGLVIGTEVELLRFAPLGDPLEIRFRGCHLTLRKHEADQILVQPITARPSVSADS